MHLEQAKHFLRKQFADSFSQTFWLQSYFVLVLGTSGVFNLIAVIPSDTNLHRLSDDYEQRIHQIGLLIMIVLGVAGFSYPIVRSYNDLRHDRILPIRREPILSEHVVVLMWLLSSGTVVFNIWQIIVEAVFFAKCDGVVRISNSEASRTFMLALDIAYHLFVVLFIVVQSVWIKVNNEYQILAKTACEECFLHCAIVHNLATNVALYIKMTLTEATHTFQKALEIHPEGYTCDAQNLTGSLKQLYDVHRSYVGLVGFAVAIESLLTLAIFVCITYEQIQEDEAEKQPDSSMNLIGAAVVTSADDVLKLVQRPQRMSRFISGQFRLTNYEKRLLAKAAAEGQRSGSRDESKRLSWTEKALISFVFLMCFAVTSACVVTVYGLVRTKDKTLTSTADEPFLSGDIAATVLTCLTLIVAVFCQTPRTEIAAHMRIDIALLVYGMTGLVVLKLFALFASILSSTDRLGASSQGSQAFFHLLEAIVQVYYLSRTLGYKTFKIDRMWFVDFLTLVVAAVYNVTSWGTYLFARKRTFLINSVATEFYPKVVWAGITEIFYPIAIFFRFHSSVICATLLGAHGVYMKRRQRVRVLFQQLGLHRADKHGDVGVDDNSTEIADTEHDNIGTRVRSMRMSTIDESQSEISH